MKTLRWNDFVSEGEHFHAARSIKSHREPVPLHGHNFVELFWIDSGNARHRLNSVPKTLVPGSLVLIRPGDFHAIEPRPGAPIRLTNIAFSEELYHFMADRHFGGGPICLRQDGILSAQVLDQRQIKKLNQWADELAESSRKQLHLERFLLNVLADLHHHPLLPDDLPDWLENACQKISAPEHFVRGTEGFIQLAGRSREHVARTTRQFLGTTPTDYVNQVRMRFAARQLEMKSGSILEISLACGIETLSHFYTLFRKEYGVTPRAYRLSHRLPISQSLRS